jgi:hypothetical protein
VAAEADDSPQPGGPVSRADGRTRNLPSQNGELVLEYNDLELLELLRTEAQQQ